MRDKSGSINKEVTSPLVSSDSLPPFPAVGELEERRRSDEAARLSASLTISADVLVNKVSGNNTMYHTYVKTRVCCMTAITAGLLL